MLTRVSPGIVDQSISQVGFKNKIIGGDFSSNPWQRGTTFTSIADLAYSADRWKFYKSTEGVVDILKTADAPTVASAGAFTQHCLHLDTTTADTSIASGQYMAVGQLIEGNNISFIGFGQAGTRYLTLSFWHKHTKVGTYCVAFGNSASNRSYVAEYTQNTTDTWELATITIPVDTTGTWLYDNGVGLSVRFVVASGSSFNTTANSWQTGTYLATANQVNALDNVINNFKIALVQLEVGQTASAFEQRSYGSELQLAQRYFESSFPAGVTPAQNAGNNGSVSVGQWVAASTQQATFVTSYKVNKRIAPTVTLFNPAAANAQLRNGTTNADWSATTVGSSANDYGFNITATSASGSAVGNAARIHFTADAEL